MLNKKNLLSSLLLIFSISLSFTIILLFNNPIYHVMAFWLLVIMATVIVRFEITHPLVWFSVSFALYSTAYAMLYILNYPFHYGYSKENILFSLIALTIVLIVVGVKKNKSPRFHKMEFSLLQSSKNNKKIIELILVILLIILCLSVIVMFITPFEHKNDMLSNRNIFFILGVYSSRFISFFCSFYILLFIEIDKKKSKLFIIASAILVILFSLFTGERDAMFRYLVVIILTLFILRKISKKTILILIPIGMFFLIASVYFKYFFVRGEIKQSLTDQSFIYDFLTSDFYAAGGNLQILLNNPWTESFYGFSLIVYDFISPFLPGGILVNVGVWFNDVFFPNSYSRAFTLVGEGYVIGGLLGIVIVFTLLGLVIKFLYSMALKHIYWLVLYIYSIPTIITAFRATLGTAFTGLVRIALFSIVLHFLLYLIINNRVFKKVR